MDGNPLYTHSEPPALDSGFEDSLLQILSNSTISSAALLVGRSRDRSPVVSLGIFSVVPSDKTMCPEVDSGSENEYQGFLLG
jgi:hypothetical protein